MDYQLRSPDRDISDQFLNFAQKPSLKAFEYEIAG